MIYYLKTKASSNPLRPRLKGNNKKRSDDMDKKIKGVIVSEYPFEDNSKIINIFTENGLLGVIAKGAKKVRSPFFSTTTKFNHGSFNINYKKNGISKLIDASINYDICIAQTEKTHNLCGVFSSNISLTIKTMIENDIHKIAYLINKNKNKILKFPNNSEFLNINNKEEYEESLNYII